MNGSTNPSGPVGDVSNLIVPKGSSHFAGPHCAQFSAVGWTAETINLPLEHWSTENRSPWCPGWPPPSASKIAVSARERLGVDVEDRRQRRDFNGLAETVFGPNERAEFSLLGERDKFSTFYMLWTLKEALIKALGTGFSLNPSGFEVPAVMRQGARRAVFRFPDSPDVDWRLEDLGNDDFAAAIAYESGSSC